MSVPTEFWHRHIILRAYVALARCEHFEREDYDLDAVRTDVEQEDPRAVRRATYCWEPDEQARATFCALWQLNPREFFRQMIFARPSFIQNLLYSYELQRVFGVERLAKEPEFTQFGIFKLSERRGYYVPVVDQYGLIASFAFYNRKGERKDVNESQRVHGDVSGKNGTDRK